MLFLEIQKARTRELNALKNLPDVERGSHDSDEAGLDCLRHCLGGIAPDQRELIIGYYQGEKSNKIKKRQVLSERLHIPIGTLRDWEQGRKEPDAAAKAYLRVIASAPDTVRKALLPRPVPKR